MKRNPVSPLLLILLLVACAAPMSQLVPLDATVGNSLRVTIYKASA